MFLHPDMSAAVVVDHRQALIAQADRHRLLAALRRERKARHLPARDSRTPATLGGCGRSVAPAR